MPPPAGRPHTPTGSRKRTWALIGIGLASVTTASPLYQHRVGPATRDVPYQHTLEKTSRRGPPSRFWTPERDQQQYNNDSAEEQQHSQHHRTLEYLKDEHGEALWSVVADASLQHPQGASRIQRKARSQHSSGTLRKDQKQRKRRQQVTDKFVGDSAEIVYQGENSTNENDTSSSTSSTGMGMGAQENKEGGSDDLDEDYAAFNITAQVQYNISSTGGHRDNDTASTVFTSHTQNKGNDTSPANEALYQPLRMRAILAEKRDGGEFLTVSARESLLHDIIRPALLTWSAALRVEPVVGNLTVDPFQLYDNQTCGPGLDSGFPSPKVPAKHLTEGIPDTDVILYLSIGFNPDVLNKTDWVKNVTKTYWAPESQNITRLDTKNATTASPFFDYDEVDNTLGQDEDHDDEKGKNKHRDDSYKRRGRGLQSALTETTAAAHPSAGTKPHFCLGDYVAAASYCSTDQYDRPTAAMLHICIDETFFLPENRNQQIVTVMHEIGHALGFNSRSMAHFRRPDGSPITPRVDGEIVDTEVECTGPSSGRRFANVTLPSEEILQFRTVRGGVRVADVVTPSVVQVVRNHFDCQTLPGAELESGEYTPFAEDPGEQACLGDHWERRLFQNDLMNPVVDSVEYSPFISTITLAYFADSGWYQVDLSMAEVASSWGRAAGCSFIEEKCIGEDGRVSSGNSHFFCNAAPRTGTSGHIEEINGCTADLSRKAACSLGQYDMDLPPEYQYFVDTYGTSVGGNDPYMDYCPAYAGFANGLCSNHENADLIRVSSIEQFGPRNSRCLSGTSQSTPTALCLPIACVVEDRSLRIKVDGRWELCDDENQKLTFFENDYVVCPDPRRICPTFYCQHDCLGTAGRCDYDTGACVCNLASSALVNGTMSSQVTSENSPNIGMCGGTETEQAFVSQPPVEPGIRPMMPNADSPLSDYYVPSRELLQDDDEYILKPWQTASVVVGTLLLMVVLLWLLRRRQISEQTNGGSGDGNDPPEPAINPNKHKMIATLLVDMRMNGPDGSSVAPTADTAASYCNSDLVSSDSVQPSLGQSSFENDDRSSLASEDVLAVDEFDRKPRSEVRKRRFAPWQK